MISHTKLQRWRNKVGEITRAHLDLSDQTLNALADAGLINIPEASQFEIDRDYLASYSVLTQTDANLVSVARRMRDALLRRGIDY